MYVNTSVVDDELPVVIVVHRKDHSPLQGLCCLCNCMCVQFFICIGVSVHQVMMLALCDNASIAWLPQ